MSLEVYKQANEELIKKVQEQKIYIGRLEQELTQANMNFFNEHQRRIEEKQHFLKVIYNLKTALSRAFDKVMYEVQANDYVEDSEVESIRSSNVQQRVSLAEVRRRSSGLIVRSPLKPISPQQNFSSTEKEVIGEDSKNESPLNGEVNHGTGILENITERDESNNVQKNDCNSSGMNTGIDNDKENNCESTKNRSNEMLACAILRDQNITPSAANVPMLTIMNSSLERLTVNFDEQLCLHSTPCKDVQPTINNETTSTSKTSFGEYDTLSSSRPSRSCKPTSLTEPSLSRKLRNEGQTKKRQKKKKT